MRDSWTKRLAGAKSLITIRKTKSDEEFGESTYRKVPVNFALNSVNFV